jgi:hypothetical protein
VLGHAAFLALLAIETPRHMAVVRLPVAAVDVVMVAPPQSQPAPVLSSAPTVANPPETTSPASPPAPTARSQGSSRITATDYFAGAVLNDPRNRETRKKLASLGSDERLIQLCNIEAMEQLRRWKEGFVPDHIVAYATADPAMTTTSLKAPGAAVYSGGKWYRLSFNCTATASLDGVASFDFALGRPIPRQEWEQDNLPEQVDGDATD